MKWRFNSLEHCLSFLTKPKQLLTITFLYHLSWGIFIQALLLPVFFPSWHAGHGLLAGGDWANFHDIAMELFNKMQKEGLSAWTLRPKNQAPSGLAALLYYLIFPEPWVLLPLNSLIHTASVLLLAKILSNFHKDQRTAWAGTLAFAFFPSAFIWTTQIHKDGMSILGAFLCIYGWLSIDKVKLNSLSSAIISFLKGFTLILSGLFFAWIVRPYLFEILLYGLLAITLFDLVYLAIIKTPRVTTQLAARLALLPILILVLNINSLEFAETAPETYEMERGNGGVQEINNAGISNNTNNNSRASSSRDWWVREDWVPPFLDNRFKALATSRNGIRSGSLSAKSNIDVEVHFTKASEVISYIPKALLIAVFSPFPSDWFGEGSRESNTMMRRISIFEMLVSYIGFLGLFMFLLKQRDARAWAVTLFAVSFLLPLTLVVCNGGTIYRMRYGFFHVLLGMGIAYFIDRFYAKSCSEKSNENRAVI